MRTPVRRPDAFHQIPNPGVKLVGFNGDSRINGVYRSDAIALLKKLPSESIDLVITDPAYQSLEKWRALGTTTRLKQSKGSSNVWFDTFPNERYPELFAEFYRVMKPGTFLYMFCDEETRDIVTTGFSPQSGANITHTGSYLLNAPLLKPGFKYWKALIWDKVVKGMGYHFPAQHEFIIMAEKVRAKGKHRQLNSNLVGDVISVPRLKGKGFYPTEKPEDLIDILITESSNEGEVVLDPFCGSGVVALSAFEKGRRFIVGDLEIEEATRRLRELGAIK